ncbi:MAG: FAD-binding oxidoreductase [Candidatus Lokiarchaeota archaeon]|nr:FAD-binding oxidoreductase [Candidatus Lokiarchaeota archaeon]
MLQKQVLENFQKIVGPENVDDSEVMTNAYSYNWCMEFVNSSEGKEPIPFSSIPKAVILPSTVEEVQQIVRLCNQYKIQFKAQSTGLGPWNQPSSENCVILDLRRMNKIVKIDHRSLYAVVEPYVSGAQLQAETMKFGLTVHMPGAGPQVSPLASATSMNGPGFTSPHTGHSARNVLGVEWVLPDGEILKLGSVGMKNDSDWYIGDGPGPSLRGIMRGWAGAKSGIGVFTKVAFKLFPYPCSTKFKLSGNSPDYEFEIPDYMKLYVMDCKSYSHLEKVFLAIEEEEISFICSHLSGYGLGAIFSNSIGSLMDKIPIAGMLVPLVVLIAARTKREFEYKQKVMSKILIDFNLENVIGSKYTPNSLFYAEALRSNLGLHGFIATGGFQSSKGQCDTVKVCVKTTKESIPLKKKYIKKGVIGNDFGEGVWITSYESGHYFHIESPTMFDQTDEKSVKGMAENMEENYQFDLLKHLGAPFFVEGDKMHDLFGPEMMNYHIWLRKIKKAFDPNGIADSGFYISAK